MFRNYDPWLPLKEVRLLSDGRLEARVQLDSTSKWFSGHFEGISIMPAVSLLSIVGQLVRRQGQEEGRNLEVSGFHKVRIRRFVMPGEELRISVASMPPGCQADLDFLLTSQGRTVAKGSLIITEDLV
jgi:3-hydroxymyristoyl/3-hydroxydecanoyl-(acyl carrier protein) dehydratase